MRKLLCLLLVLLLAMPAAQADETTIVHLSDLHYLSPTLTDGGEDFMAMLQEGDGKLTHYTPQLLRAFIAEMLVLRPDAVVMSGDLTLSGALQSHRELAAQLEELVDAGIPVYVLPGNHDLAKGAYCFSDIGTTIVEGTSGEEFASMYERCGYGDALVRDEGSLSYVAEIARQNSTGRCPVQQKEGLTCCILKSQKSLHLLQQRQYSFAPVHSLRM